MANFMNNAIRKITPDGMVTTGIKSECEVSINTSPGLTNGPVGAAQFNGSDGIAAGSNSSLYSAICTIMQYIKLHLNKVWG